MEIKVIKSPQRRRTASAYLKNGVLEIRLPGWLPQNQAQKIINKFITSFKKKERPKPANDEQLKKLADRLSQQYFQGKLKYQICWSKNQKAIQGSCAFKNHTIRISQRLKEVPVWVLKSVIMHELAHLLVPNHSKKFWQIANQYPLMERARGYLLAFERYQNSSSKKETPKC